MTIDKSLKVRKGVSRSRNVLTRVERIEKLRSQDRWEDGNSPFNLPKVRVHKVVLKKKKKAQASDEAPAEAE
ncbi:MAG: small basic protein [Thermoguttaceae bacterium]|jgi:small basic protein (TIGR04137 family)